MRLRAVLWDLWLWSQPWRWLYRRWRCGHERRRERETRPGVRIAEYDRCLRPAWHRGDHRAFGPWSRGRICVHGWRDSRATLPTPDGAHG